MCQILRALLVLLKKGIYLIKQITLADLCEMNYRKLIKQQLVSSVRAVRNYFQYFSYPFMIFQDNMDCEL